MNATDPMPTLTCHRCRLPFEDGKCGCADSATVLHGDCIPVMNALPADSVDLVFGSPPYCDARTYGIGAVRDCEEWVAWMLDVSEAAARVSRGPVLWVIGTVTRKRCYWPAYEGLSWEWWKRGGTHQLYRPCFFHRVGIPGSGGKDWFRADVEFVLCLKRPGKLAYSNNKAMGHPPRWAPGGEMSHRLSDGKRVNQWGPVGGPGGGGAKRADGTLKKRFRPSHRQQTKCRANGEMEEQSYAPPAIANPGNVVEATYTATEVAELLAHYEQGDWCHLTVGKGHMGDPLAHENEAPFPEDLARWFLLSCCPPGGIVLDPFLGSGTTLAVAKKEGRRGIGIDLRDGQCDIAVERLRQGVLFL